MHHHLEVQKTIEAVGALFRAEGVKQMSALRLLKLLYMADRESLKETGRSITGDRVVAMEHGPVLSNVYDLIKGQHADLPHWSEFFTTTGYRINERKEPGVGRLSRQELNRLREVAQRNMDKSDWEVAELTHEFEEWKRNNPGKSSRPITLEHIIEAVGRAQDMESILQDATDRVAYDHLFGE